MNQTKLSLVNNSIFFLNSLRKLGFKLIIRSCLFVYSEIFAFKLFVGLGTSGVFITFKIFLFVYTFFLINLIPKYLLTEVRYQLF